MAGSIWCIFRTILGCWSSQIVRRSVRGDFGNISGQFNSCCIMDSCHIIGPVLGIGSIVIRTLSKIFVSLGSVRWRFILCPRSYAEFICNELIPFAIHVWDSDR